MDDLISRAAAIKKIISLCPDATLEGSYDEYAVSCLCGVVEMIKALPTVDAAPVVRCKQCVHWLRDTLRQNSNDVAWWNEAVCDRHSYDGLEIIEKWTSADFYCADGERREEDAADRC